MGLFSKPPGVVAHQKNLKKFKELERRFPWIWGILSNWIHLGRGFCPIKVINDPVQMTLALTTLPDRETRVFVFWVGWSQRSLHQIDPGNGKEIWLKLIHKRFDIYCKGRGSLIRAVAVLKARNGRFDLDPEMTIFTAQNEKDDLPLWAFALGGATTSAR